MYEDVEEQDGEEISISGYELSLKGDSNVYHELTTEQNMEESEQLAEVEAFDLMVSLDAETNYPRTIFTRMNGTMEVEGETIQVEEVIHTHIKQINTYEEGVLRVPSQVEIIAETDEDEE